jgi:helix-turn-helix protein
MVPGLGVGRQERPGHVELTASIRRRVDARPTYGYRRINALLKRERRADGLAPVNAKRIYRLTRKHDLLLQRHTVRRRLRGEDGQVITIRSNCRWCSDAFEFTCWNGEVVRVAFARDRRDYVRGPDPGRRCSLCTRAIAGWRTTTPFSRTPDWATGHRASTFFPNPTRVRFNGVNSTIEQITPGLRSWTNASFQEGSVASDRRRAAPAYRGWQSLVTVGTMAGRFVPNPAKASRSATTWGTGPHWPLAWARIVRCVPTSALPEGRVRMLGWRRRSRSGYTTQRHTRHRAYSRGGHWRIIRCRVGPGTSTSRRLTPIFMRVAPPGSNCRDCHSPIIRPRRRRAS